MTRLDHIAARQRRTLVRDVLFTAFVALATVVCATTVGQAADASAMIARR